MNKAVFSRFYSPLGRRLLLAIVSISTLIALASASIIIYFNYRQGVHQYEEVVTQIHNGYQKSLSYSMWNFDVLQIESQLKGIMNFPGITYLQIDSNGKILLSMGDMYQEADKKMVIPIKYDGEENHFLGNLRMNQSYQPLYQELYLQAIAILASQFILIFIISILLFLTLHQIITKRLNILTNWAMNFNLDRLDQELVIDNEYAQPDELSQVANAINHMRQTLKFDMEANQLIAAKSEQMQKELNLAVDNAALGFCHYDVLQKRFYCNSHFASQLGSTEVDIENLRDPLAFFMRLIIGENAKRQRERIELLLMGDVSRINDIFQIQNPNTERTLNISFQAIRYQENRPSEILICMLDRSEEQRCKAQLRAQESLHEAQVLDIKKTYSEENQILFDELSQLRKDILSLRNRQQPQHLTLLLELMKQSLITWKQGLNADDYALWERFLSLKLFDVHAGVDLINYSHHYLDNVQKRHKISIKRQFPFTLMLEESFDVLDFFSDQIFSDALLKQCYALDVHFQVEPKRLVCNWRYQANQEIQMPDNCLSCQLAQILVSVRYSGMLHYQKEGNELLIKLLLPFNA